MSVADEGLAIADAVLVDEQAIAGVVGNPLGHSLSPTIFHAAFEAACVAGTYAVLETDDFDETVDEVRGRPEFRGLSVTIPFKRRAVEYADFVSDDAELAESANVLAFRNGDVHAHTTDGDGLLGALNEGGFEIAGSRCFVVGCGGGGRAAALALAHGGASELILFNRTTTTAEGLEWTLKALGFPVAVARSIDSDLIASCDLLVNATSVGMTGNDSPFDLNLLDRAAIERTLRVFDMVYRSDETALVRSARQHGLAAQGGLRMLVHQAIAAWPILFGTQAPMEAMLNSVH